MVWKAGGVRSVQGDHAAIVDAIVDGFSSLRGQVAGSGAVPGFMVGIEIAHDQ